MFELKPRPRGHEHPRWSELYRCLQRNGVPGFDVVEIRAPEGRR